MMKKLTHKEIDQVLEAAEMIETKEELESCDALEFVSGRTTQDPGWGLLASKYQSFYNRNPHKLWVDPFASNKAKKKIRIMWLLWFRELKGDLG